MLRCEDISVGISFSKNVSQSFSLSSLDHFIVIKRQWQLYWSTRHAFYHYSHITLITIAVQLSTYIALLSSKGNGNHFELREKLFMIIRIGGFAVSLEFDMLGVKITARPSHSLKTLLRMLFRVSRSLCCHKKATRIVFVFTRNFS